MLIQIILGAGLILFLILYLIERKNKKELHLLNNKKKIIEYYNHKISEIENSKITDPEKMEKIKILSKKLFNDYYELDLNESYSKLTEFFSTKNHRELKEFSEIMLKYYYKEEQVNESVIKRLIAILKDEVKNIPLREEDIKEIEEYPKNKKQIDKETHMLLGEIKGHLDNKKRKEAEDSYEKLEKLQEKTPEKKSTITKKMNKLYDQIIHLYHNSGRKILKNDKIKNLEKEKIEQPQVEIIKKKPSMLNKINTWIVKKKEESKKRAEERNKEKEKREKIKEEEKKKEEKARIEKRKIEEKIFNKEKKEERTTEDIKKDEAIKSKIRILLLQSQNYTDLKMNNRAVETYSKIKELYSNLNNKDPELYEKIMTFYKGILSTLKSR